MQLIEDVLVNLATGADPQLRDETVNSIGAWKDAPFRPHVVARYRPTAYMFKAVMAYLDNLVAWGDALFRQDTGESINEATQLYVLAANLLGPRPEEVPRKGWQPTQTYESLRGDLDELSNAMREIEADIPFDLTPHPTEVSDDAQLAALSSLGTALYFCVPRNDKLLSYWDTVADRLFKIRNSLNIQGVFRQLPLFDPPIDPAHAGPRGRRRPRCRRDRQRAQPAAAAGSVPGPGQPGSRDLPGGQVARRPAARRDREEGRRGAHRACAPGRNGWCWS